MPYYEDMPAYHAIALRFRSGNAVEIERATITREEWQAFLAELEEKALDDLYEWKETMSRYDD